MSTFKTTSSPSVIAIYNIHTSGKYPYKREKRGKDYCSNSTFLKPVFIRHHHHPTINNIKWQKTRGFRPFNGCCLIPEDYADTI